MLVKFKMDAKEYRSHLIISWVPFKGCENHFGLNWPLGNPLFLTIGFASVHLIYIK